MWREMRLLQMGCTPPGVIAARRVPSGSKKVAPEAKRVRNTSVLPSKAESQCD